MEISVASIGHTCFLARNLAEVRELLRANRAGLDDRRRSSKFEPCFKAGSTGTGLTIRNNRQSTGRAPGEKSD